MRFRVIPSLLSGVLGQLIKIVPVRASHLILGNFYMKAENDHLSVKVFDLAIAVTLSLPVEIIEEGECLLPAKIFTDIISALSSEDEVTCTKNSTLLRIESETGDYQLECFDNCDDFPLIPNIKELEEYPFIVNDFFHSLKLNSTAVSSDETKQVLCGISCKLKNGIINFAATDGHRMSSLKTMSNWNADNINIVIPSKILALSKLFGESEEGLFSFNEAFTQIKTSTVCLIFRNLEGVFPDIERLISASFKCKAVVKKIELLQALKRINTFSFAGDTKTGIGVLCSFSTSGLTLQLHHINQSVFATYKAQENLAIESYAGEPLDVLLNLKYLMDGLKNIETGLVEFSMINSNTLIGIKPEDKSDTNEGNDENDDFFEYDFYYWLMPMQISRSL